MPQLILIALSTLASEDLASAGAGALVSQGRISLIAAILASFFGIFLGDLALLALGRLAGDALFRMRVTRRWLRESDVQRAGDWLSRHGAAAVFTSRFTPGLRTATYVAAGLARVPVRRFAALMAAAAAIWTPLVVGATALAGMSLVHTSRAAALAAAAGAFWAVRAAIHVLSSFEWRRRLRAWFARKIRWEFWPAWAAYLPVAPYLLYLAVRYRSLTMFTASNPGIPSGGFVGESKSAILEELARGDSVARFALLTGANRPGQARGFMVSHNLSYPIVLKPNVGERGAGVAIVRSECELDRYLRTNSSDIIIQEYVNGPEFGVFYCRYPHEQQGRILSITEKRLPYVTGDGASSIERLVLRDPRAYCIADQYLKRLNRTYVPNRDEMVRLVEIGAHCRGSVFVDARHLNTKAIEQKIDAISHRHRGFFFGRYDLRAESAEAFQQGRGFKILELNGVSAEPVHIYDPSVSLLDAYRTLLAHWKAAFEIGALNKEEGAQPLSTAALWKLVREKSRREKVSAPGSTRAEAALGVPAGAAPARPTNR